MLGVAARVLGTDLFEVDRSFSSLGRASSGARRSADRSNSVRSVLVIAAHPDDEALFASGIIYQAKQAGQNVKVVIMTNGDCDTHDIGLAREQESITAMTRLGLATSDVIFLGYPDCGLRDIYYYYTDVNSQFTSVAGFSATYGSLGLGNSDYHRYMYGVSARYNGVNMLTDLEPCCATTDRRISISRAHTTPIRTTTSPTLRSVNRCSRRSKPTHRSSRRCTTRSSTSRVKTATQLTTGRILPLRQQ